jgi:hypothetical protein
MNRSINYETETPDQELYLGEGVTESGCDPVKAVIEAGSRDEAKEKLIAHIRHVTRCADDDDIDICDNDLVLLTTLVNDRI